MRKTKEIILDTALDLFNTKGLSQTTLRTIARKMGISQGNLNYHYKKREDIIEALYFQLVKKINESIPVSSPSDDILKTLFSMSNSVMQHLFEYRFFLLDFVQVMRAHNQIRKHFIKLTATREAQFMGFIRILVEQDLMRKELLPNEYKNLCNRIQILGDFWISSAQIFNRKITHKLIYKYEEMINQSIYPYLTEKGRQVYHQIKI